MKATYAGPNVPLTNIRSYLSCCNGSKEYRDYFIPCTSLSEVQVYVSFTAKPTTQLVSLYNLCNDTHSAIVPDQYIIGIDPDGGWYGVFTFNGLVAAPALFALALEFQVGATTAVYFTEAYSTEDCRPLMRVEACFPIARTDEFGFDCNGLYFGTTTDMPNSLGTLNLAYNHFAYVRQAKVVQEAPKITFTSNVYRNFRTNITRQYELRTEIVPDWYKEYLLAIYSRGFIQVDGVIYRVTELAFEGLNDQDTFWKPYAKLIRESEFQFGCQDCTPAVIILPCVNTMIPADWFMDGSVFYQPFHGNMPTGGKLPWQILSQDGSQTLAQGVVLSAPWQASAGGLDPLNNCYQLRWRVQCDANNYSDWQQSQIGQCGPRVIDGCVVVLFNTASVTKRIFCSGDFYSQVIVTARISFRQNGAEAAAPVDMQVNLKFLMPQCDGSIATETVPVVIPAGQRFVLHNWIQQDWIDCGSGTCQSFVRQVVDEFDVITPVSGNC